MRPITRRQALVLGAAGAGGIVVGGIGLSRTGPPWAPEPAVTAGAGGDLAEPDVLTGRDGTLAVELTMAERDVRIGDRTARMATYNGTVPGPTLRVRPGDTLAVRLVNDLAAVTNLHVHGMHVSPEGNGDNPFLAVGPGESFDYELALPADHPTGTFWYHPHHHGTVADQLFAGLYGAIVVEDDLPVARERVLVVSDVSLTTDGRVRQASMPERMMGREGETVLVNGQVEPTITGAAGERQRWRVVNACTSRFLRLELAGHRAELLGVDVGLAADRTEAGDLVLAPGNRADLLVTLGDDDGEWRALPYDRGSMGMMGGGVGGRSDGTGSVRLARVEVSGTATEAAVDLPRPPTPPDVREAVPDRRRTITFTMGMGRGMGGGPMFFGLDNKEYDADRTDQEVAASALEEWTIENPTPMDHPFHLHVWPMQVLDDGTGPVSEPRWRDVVNVPAGGRVVVRVPFETFTGRTVYHCHILDHEDNGMMAVVEVGGPGAALTAVGATTRDRPALGAAGPCSRTAVGASPGRVSTPWCRRSDRRRRGG